MTNSITDLINSFIDTIQKDHDTHTSKGQSNANLLYEMDCLISDFLDSNEIPISEYSNIQNDVINSIEDKEIQDLLMEPEEPTNHAQNDAETEISHMNHEANAHIEEVESTNPSEISAFLE